MTPELQAVRRAIERDRYGLMAYVFVARDHCTAADCAAFRALTDYHQIVVNMDERTYEGLVARYAPTWNAPTTPAPVAALAPLVPSMPTGKPTNAEFPTAASTPPVSIMTPEPGTTAAPAPRAAAPAASAPVPSPRPPAAALASAKKPAAPKASRSTPAPVQIAPAAPAPAAPAPAASND
jgi:hypothetical protein